VTVPPSGRLSKVPTIAESDLMTVKTVPEGRTPAPLPMNLGKIGVKSKHLTLAIRRQLGIHYRALFII
jgi:hypothetical protein